MGKVIAAITTSVDGYVTGPDDGPSAGLGVGGERLHYWVMGGPWTYDDQHDPDRHAGGRQGVLRRPGREPRGRCLRPRDVRRRRCAGAAPTRSAGGCSSSPTARRTQPDPATGFTFVDGFAEALAAARAEAGDRDVSIAGGADVIRQALDAGEVDELVVSVAPVVLSAGKRLFEGFTRDLDLEIRSVHHSPYAVHTTYAVVG